MLWQRRRIEQTQQLICWIEEAPGRARACLLALRILALAPLHLQQRARNVVLSLLTRTLALELVGFGLSLPLALSALCLALQLDCH